MAKSLRSRAKSPQAMAVSIAVALTVRGLADAADAAEAPKVAELEEIIVEAKRRASTATRFELNVIETPQSIKAITNDVISFASVRDFADLARVDASTTTNGTYLGRQHLSFRGLDASTDQGIKIDGIQTLAEFPLDLSVFERIEILKGPSSAVYGQNSAGGMINAVTKQPLSVRANSVDVSIGSFDYRRLELDSTGPVTSDARLAYRLFGAYAEGGEFVDFVDSTRHVAFGSLRYDLSDATALRANVHFQEQSLTPNKGLAAVTDNAIPIPQITLPDVPASRFVGAPWADTDGDYLSTHAEVAHKLAENWQIEAGVTYDTAGREGTGTGFFDLFSPNGDIDQTYLTFDDEENVLWGGEVGLTGKFEMLGRSHTLYFGLDARDVETEALFLLSPGAPLFNIYAPDYSGFGPPRRDLADFNDAYFSREIVTDERYRGGTLQLLLHPTERLSVLAGGRYDSSRQSRTTAMGRIVGGTFVPNPTSAVSRLDTDRVVPQVGVTFEIAPEVNLYANYSRSFVPQRGITVTGGGIPPEEGRQYELGIKGNFFDRRLTATLAGFEILRNHIAGIDPAAPTFSRDIGEQKSRGVELELFGELVRGWTVFGSVAYLDAKIEASSSPVDVGARLFNVPRWAGSLYSTYEIPLAQSRSLGFGGGVVTKQNRVWGYPSFSWLRQQVDGGGYTVADVRVFYRTEHALIEVKVNNVADEKYYNQFFPGMKGGMYPGRPLEVIGRITYRF